MAEATGRKGTVTIWRVGPAWYWQLRGSNGRYLAMSPAGGYTSKRNAEAAIAATGETLTSGFFNTRVVSDAATEPTEPAEAA